MKRTDPVMERLVSTWKYLRGHQKTLYYGGIALVVIVLGIWVFQLLSSRSAMRRTADLNKALEAYTAVDLSSPDKKTGADSETAKLNAAFKALSQVASDYGTSHEGLSAAILKASCLRRLGKMAEAEGVLRKVIENATENQMRQVAKLSLAETLRISKKYPEALAIYDELAKSADLIVAKEQILLDKARTLQDSGQLEPAYKVISEVNESIKQRKADDPDAPPISALEVQNRLENLKTQMLAKGLKVS